MLMTFRIGILVNFGILTMICKGLGIPVSARHGSLTVDHLGLTSFKKGENPTSVPADIKESIQHELDSLNAVLGVDGENRPELTGISTHECAEQIKGQDLNSMTCTEFIDTLSNCDSLLHANNLVQAAKKKSPHSKKPCFSEELL